MSHLPHRTLICPAGLLVAASLFLASAGAADRSDTVQQRIDTLLKYRLRPEALPVDPPNPFLLVNRETRDSAVDRTGSKPTDGGTLPPGELPIASSVEILLDCAARLKIGGIIVINGQTQIVINGVRRKEGDVVVSDWNDSTVNLRLVRLLPGHVVLRFGESETTRKF